MPTTIGSAMVGLPVTCAPSLMRVRTRGPDNCTGSEVTPRRRDPGWYTGSDPKELRAPCFGVLIADPEDIRNLLRRHLHSARLPPRSCVVCTGCPAVSSAAGAALRDR